ncbi:MAG TPA: carbamate kinase [Anaerolineae bacterium]|nr:carbamate kinase [Anaerolineae bacterium]
MTEGKIAVVAIGGNSLILDRQHQRVEDQWVAVRETCKHLVGMIQRGWNLIITHGNGPQVGFILRRSEIAEKVENVHSTPLDIIGADTQGSIGYMIAQALGDELRRLGIDRQVAAVVTQVLVDKDDPAFQDPTKGIGGFVDEEDARKFEADGWVIGHEAGRGWRRKIASPIPLEIIELDAVRTLVDAGFVVITVGGGGIPVVREEGGLRGTRSVIDKDRASSLLAQNLKADLLLISTGVEQVALHFATPEQKWLDTLTAAEAKRYLEEGQFPPGNMGPKIEAIVQFLEANPGGKALITDPFNIVRALNGETGTWLVP